MNIIPSRDKDNRDNFVRAVKSLEKNAHFEAIVARLKDCLGEQDVDNRSASRTEVQKGQGRSLMLQDILAAFDELNKPVQSRKV